MSRLQAIDLDAQLRNAIFIGGEDHLVLSAQEARNVGRHEKAHQRQRVARQQQREETVEEGGGYASTGLGLADGAAETGTGAGGLRLM